MSLVEAEAEAQNGHAGGSEAAALEEALAEAWRTPVPAGKGETAAVSPVDGTPHRCERCNSKEIEPHGWRYNESEPVQRYRCKACGKRFVFRLGFERMRSPAWAVVDTLDLYFKRLSLFEAADFLRRKGISVHPTTVGRWVQKFVSMCVPYLEGLKALVGDRWYADEIWMRIVGKRMYLFLTMDSRTRLCLSFELGEKKDGHNACAPLRNARKRAGKIPLDFVSDALPSYSKAHEAEYAQNNARQPCCTHTRDIHLRNQRDDNNIQERFNETIRDRAKVLRGLKKKDSPVLPGMIMYYNFFRPHSDIGGITPAKAAGIKIGGQDKWLTVIGNAAMSRKVT